MVNGDRKAELYGWRREPGGAEGHTSTNRALATRPASSAVRQGAHGSQLGPATAAVAARNWLAAKPRAFGLRQASDLLRWIAAKRPCGASGHDRIGYQPLRLSHPRQ